jgi:hypothetical protein
MLNIRPQVSYNMRACERLISLATMPGDEKVTADELLRPTPESFLGSSRERPARMATTCSWTCYQRSDLLIL